MPNRILKESIRESYSINQLSDKAEILFYRLVTYADDFGLFKADPCLVNKALFPLKDYREKQVTLWLDEIGAAGMVAFYQGSDDKPYGYFLSWDKHQQQRAQKAKHPKPDERSGEPQKSLTIILHQLKSDDINGKQVKSDVPVIQSNPIQSETESNPNTDGLFDVFWKEYPKKQAKPAAERAFQRANPSQEILDRMIKVIQASRKTEGWQEKNGKYIPQPATWLNQRRWEDETTDISKQSMQPERTWRDVE